MKIMNYNCNFEREELKSPFGFKGGYISELWQTIVNLQNQNNKGTGLGVQSILWSDSNVFSTYPEAVGNSMMFLTTSFAANLAKDLSWDTPIDLLEQLLSPTYEYAKTITNTKDLRLTFALNALVSVDNAAWQIYANTNNIDSFDDMIPEEFKASLSHKHDKLAAVPLISYAVSMKELTEEVNSGSFFLKIKIGSDPDKDGNLDKMLEWDKKRISEIHNVVKNIKTPYTDSGYIPYYLDANGRYDSKERLIEFLEHTKKIGALERILILEEPFPEEYKVDISDLPIRIAADESAHSDKDAIERINLGYKAIALKPIAKTLSMSFKIAKVAYEKDIPCFCADLTVNPLMVDWNKNMAARLKALPGIKIGILESNGHQNYKNWDKMKSYHPAFPASWIETKYGLYILDDDFYRQSGGIFLASQHYK